MFIVWGTKRVNTKIGYVADFCYLCRDIRPFNLFRVGMARHVYYISAGQGELAGHYRECKHCHCQIDASTVNYAEVLTNPKGENMETLTAKTFPNIRTHYAKRLELESALKKDPSSIDPQTRTQLLAEPFYFMAPLVEARFGQTRLDWTMAGIIAAAFAIAVVIANVIRMFFPSAIDMIPMLTMPILGAGVLGMIIQHYRAGRMYMSKTIYPVMSLALRPLRPQEAELKAIAGNVLKKNTAFKRKFSLKQMMKSVSQAGAMPASAR